VEKLLIENGTEKVEVRAAFAEAFFTKAQQRVEVDGKNPALLSAFLRAVTEYKTNTGDTGTQLIAKVSDS
jgi:hypothetical protein